MSKNLNKNFPESVNEMQKLLRYLAPVAKMVNYDQ